MKNSSGFLVIAPLVVYIFAPEQLAWAALPTPAGWRWFGVGLDRWHGRYYG